jgi:hypothetical protein
MRVVLKLGGEDIPLYFGMVAFEEMQGLLTNYMGSNKYATDVVWAGYINQCAIDSLSPTMNYSDVMQKLEEHFFSNDDSESNLNDVLSVFDKSKAGSKLFDVVDKAVGIVSEVAEQFDEQKKKRHHTKNSRK